MVIQERQRDAETATTWVWISEPSLTNWVSLNELLNTAMPQFPHLWNGAMETYVEVLLWGLNELMQGKPLEQCLMQDRPSTDVSHYHPSLPSGCLHTRAKKIPPSEDRLPVQVFWVSLSGNVTWERLTPANSHSWILYFQVLPQSRKAFFNFELLI